jgi:hypothetical protein
MSKRESGWRRAMVVRLAYARASVKVRAAADRFVEYGYGDPVKYSVPKVPRRPWWTASDSPTLSLILAVLFFFCALLVPFGIAQAHGWGKATLIGFEAIILINAAMQLATTVYLRTGRGSDPRLDRT